MLDSLLLMHDSFLFVLYQVVELGRDVLCCAGVLDSSAWEGLLRHMDQRNMTRTFIQVTVLSFQLALILLAWYNVQLSYFILLLFYFLPIPPV